MKKQVLGWCGEMNNKNNKSKKKAKRFITKYPYEDIFIHDMSAVKQLSIFDEGISNAECYKHDYVFKRITSGNQLEVEAFPGFFASRIFLKSEKTEQTRDLKKIKENNTRKKYKKFERYVHANFKAGDLNITLTFNDSHQPSSKEETKKALNRFIDSVNKKRKRRGLTSAKYIYVLEQGLRYRRWHIHIIMDKLLPMEEIAKTWKKKGIAEIELLAYMSGEEREDFVPLCRYLTKHKDNYPKLYEVEAWDFIYGRSQNLATPKEKQNKTPIPKKDIKRMTVKEKTEQLETARRVFEKKYKDYEVTDITVKTNSHFDNLHYIHVRMQKRRI
jgi:hypothetical protein